jgi:hypothetical protein
MTSLKRKRWGARAVLAVGLIASAAGNVLHAQPSGISRVISAWPVLALYLAIDLISRIPVHRPLWAVCRIAAAALIAGIAAWVSYWHMVGVAARYGETGASPYLLPLSVDGLVVVASICLVELGGRITDAERLSTSSKPMEVYRYIGARYDHERPIGPELAPIRVDSLSTSGPRIRKPQPSSQERVERAHKRTPHATDEQLAQRLDLSIKTIRRWRPREAEKPEQINGNEPELALTSR